MKVLMATIFFQLPDDFEGDDLNEALEEFIKYRRENNLSSLKISKAQCEEIRTFDNTMYNNFWKMISDKNNVEKSIHASGIHILSPDGKKWLDNGD